MQALALLDPDPPDSLPYDVRIRRQITRAGANSFLQRFTNAQKQLADAQRLAASYQRDLLGEVAMSRGTLEFLLDDLPSAQSAYQSALSSARESSDEFLEASALGSLGLVAMRERHYDQTIDLDTAALQAARRLGDTTSVARVLGNLGWSYFEMGDFETARSDLGEAERESNQLGMLRDRNAWLNDLGEVFLDQDDFSHAENYYRQALDLSRKLGDQWVLNQCLNNLSIVALEQGNLSSANEYNREALELSVKIGDRFSAPYAVLMQGRILAATGNFQDARKRFEQVLHDAPDLAPLRWEADVRLAQLYEKANQPADAEREYRASIATIEGARSSIHAEEFRLSFLTSAVDFYNAYIDFLAARGRPVDALKIAEFSRAQTLLEGLGVRATKITALSHEPGATDVARKTDSVILSYWLSRRHSWLWAATPSGQIKMVSLPGSAEIDSLVQAYRRALLGPRDPLDARDASGRKLYEMLVAPAAPLIPAGSRVVVVPDGSLYALNFETLPVPLPVPHYWIDDVTITSANSVALLAAARASLRQSPKLLLVGDPVSPSSDFPALPQAASEMGRVEKYFPAGTEVLSDDRATAAAYLASDPGRFSFIHFVAHGTASLSSPLDSAIILSKQGDSYKLYARDIVKQPLHAELVTISACHGEGVRTYSGEGLVGLAWAFLRAGAHGVIAALWEVDDTSTPELMDALYAGIRSGKSPAAALRNAKLSLLHSGTIYRKPFYWAPFQFYAGS